MSDNAKNLGGRAYLVAKLKERAFPVVKSVLIVNVILERTIRVLKRVPGGRVSVR